MSEFVEYLIEVFEEFGPVQARRMFGGYGIYHKGVMFGLVADDTLYLKADETTAEYFHSKGLGQFEYAKGEKKVKMSYYLAPEEVLENPGEAKLWADRAYEAAMRTNARKRKRQKSAKRSNPDIP